jgi:hypothetical protein
VLFIESLTASSVSALRTDAPNGVSALVQIPNSFKIYSKRQFNGVFVIVPSINKHKVFAELVLFSPGHKLVPGNVHTSALFLVSALGISPLTAFIFSQAGSLGNTFLQIFLHHAATTCVCEH